MYRRLSALFVTGFLFLSCSPTQPEPELDSSPQAELVRSEIEARGEEFIRMYEAGEVDAVAEIFTEDARLKSPGGPEIVGREKIRQHVAQGLAVGGWQQVVTLEEAVSCGAFAIARGDYSITFVPDENSPPGMTAFIQRGSYVIEWRRIGINWFIDYYIGSNSGPAEGVAAEPPGDQESSGSGN